MIQRLALAGIIPIVIVGHSWGIGCEAMRLARALGRWGDGDL